MLVLTRKIGEKILIGDDIEILVIGVRSREKVRIGVQAPPDIAVDREEVRKSKDEERSTRNGRHH